MLVEGGRGKGETEDWMDGELGWEERGEGIVLAFCNGESDIVEGAVVAGRWEVVGNGKTNEESGVEKEDWGGGLKLHQMKSKMTLIKQYMPGDMYLRCLHF